LKVQSEYEIFVATNKQSNEAINSQMYILGAG